MDPLENEIHPDMVKVWKVRAVIEDRDRYSSHFSLSVSYD